MCLELSLVADSWACGIRTVLAEAAAPRNELKETLMIRMRAGFDRNHPDIAQAKMGIQMAKNKSSIPNAIKLPKPKSPCSCGSGKKYTSCCF